MPLTQAIIAHRAGDLPIGLAAALIVALVCAPLFRHLWQEKVVAPEHVPHRSAHEDAAAAAVDKYSTKWGVGASTKRTGAP
jgi:hypothetical protein